MEPAAQCKITFVLLGNAVAVHVISFLHIKVSGAFSHTLDVFFLSLGLLFRGCESTWVSLAGFSYYCSVPKE